MDNHVTRWIEEDGIKFYTARRLPDKVYIRFGKWGRRHRSYMGKTRTQEKGLSVYNARVDLDGLVSLVTDDWSLKHTAEDCTGALQGRLVWPVTGKVVGTGSDGEPVLTQVKVLRLPIRVGSIPKETKEI